MSKVYLEDSTLTSIGNAIRTKTGKSNLILPTNMATEIKSIEGGGVVAAPSPYDIRFDAPAGRLLSNKYSKTQEMVDGTVTAAWGPTEEQLKAAIALDADLYMMVVRERYSTTAATTSGAGDIDEIKAAGYTDAYMGTGLLCTISTGTTATNGSTKQRMAVRWYNKTTLQYILNELPALDDEGRRLPITFKEINTDSSRAIDNYIVNYCIPVYNARYIKWVRNAGDTAYGYATGTVLSSTSQHYGIAQEAYRRATTYSSSNVYPISLGDVATTKYIKSLGGTASNSAYSEILLDQCNDGRMFTIMNVYNATPSFANIAGATLNYQPIFPNMVPVTLFDDNGAEGYTSNDWDNEITAATCCKLHVWQCLGHVREDPITHKRLAANSSYTDPGDDRTLLGVGYASSSNAAGAGAWPIRLAWNEEDL
jgi:hypothetical protein